MGRAVRRYGEGKAEILRLNREHPEWTRRQLAREMGCDDAYVRAVGYRCGLTFAQGQAHVPAPKPSIDSDLAFHCLALFRGQRMDTLSIGRHIGRHESEILRLLQHAREAERAA